jgi:7-cyano-7-deazaguanine synthase
MSGGLDSTVALAIAKENEEHVTGITFQYGQRHLKELEAAKAIANHYGIMHVVTEVTLGSGGVLMTEEEMPHETYEGLAAHVGPSPTYVPYRNGTFLSIAASFAVAEGVDMIYAGMHAEDAHNWAYPDCTPEFIGAMQNAIYVGTYHAVRLVCPFTYATKKDIVRIGAEMQVPFSKTWSCYEGRKVACGKCPTCVGRLEAFKANGYNDPIPYEFDQYRTRGVDKLSAIQTSAKLRDMLAKED